MRSLLDGDFDDNPSARRTDSHAKAAHENPHPDSTVTVNPLAGVAAQVCRDPIGTLTLCECDIGPPRRLSGRRC